MESKYPNLIIAGSPKCGSSSIFFWLSKHPEICASSVKETGFLLDSIQGYNSSNNYITNGLSGYSAFFSHYGGQKVLMEATPEYLIQKEIPFKAFKEMDQLPKVLFVFRKPSERIYSAYKFHKYTTNRIPSELTFDDYLKNSKGMHMVEISYYFKHLQRWINFLGRDKVFVCLFEDLKSNPRKVLENISDWVGIDIAYWKDQSFDAKNQTQNINNQLLHKLAINVNQLVPRGLAERIIKPIYYRINAKRAPDVSDSERLALGQLDELFEEANRSLEALIGLPTTNWNRSHPNTVTPSPHSALNE
jgi:hypothetical protein